MGTETYLPHNPPVPDHSFGGTSVYFDGVYQYISVYIGVYQCISVYISVYRCISVYIGLSQCISVCIRVYQCIQCLSESISVNHAPLGRCFHGRYLHSWNSVGAKKVGVRKISARASEDIYKYEYIVRDWRPLLVFEQLSLENRPRGVWWCHNTTVSVAYSTINNAPCIQGQRGTSIL